MSNEMAKDTVIRLKNIAKIFFTDEIETHALNNVSLEIATGDLVTILGPSGCGKSTLLAVLGMLDEATSGQYWLSDTEIAGLSKSDRTKIRNQEIGFIFQSFNLIGDLTVAENVGLPLTYRGGVSKVELKERALKVLKKVGMDHRANHFPSQLSGGQQQRVAVARALIGNPSIILADEPTGNLDSKNGEAVMELLLSLHQEGATVCIVTHDPRYMNLEKSRSINLYDGSIA
jgi:putative ABC transport system ATP-binding protein